MDELKCLIRKRATSKHKLSNLIKYIDILDNYIAVSRESITEKQRIELELRIKNANQLQNEFESIQAQIECVCDEQDLNNHLEYRDDFTNSFSSALAAAHIYLNNNRVNEPFEATDVDSSKSDNRNNSLNNVNDEVNSANVSCDNLKRIKLPTIELPKFTGDYKEWLLFKDTFQSLIHNNESINNVQKFHYLRASLGNNPMKVIQSLEFSAENYEKSWQLLCQRYNKSQLLVHNHLKAIFDLDNLNKENANGLRYMIDTMSEHLRALETLKQPTQHWDQILIYVITKKLDRLTIRDWDQYKTAEEFPTFNEFIQFLTNRADSLETFETSQPKSRLNCNTNMRHSFVGSTKLQCYFCNNSHTIYNCNEFLKLPVSIRLQKVKNLKLCLNCLCKGHDVTRCKSRPCKICNRKHNSLLHINRESPSPEKEDVDTQMSFAACTYNQLVLLSTAVVEVKDSYGKTHFARALLDSGSQINFITTKLRDNLNLEQVATNISVSGINKSVCNLNSKVELSIKSVHSNFHSNIVCYTLPKITDTLPNQDLDTRSWNIPRDIPLADPQYGNSKYIDILLGADIFWKVVYNECYKLRKGLPTLRNTAFGWIICGSLNQPPAAASCYLTNTAPVTAPVLGDLNKFWEIEEIDKPQIISNDDELCESHFKSNVKKTENGQFMVRIPLKFPATLLGNSRDQALSRLLTIEKRFKNSPDLKIQYVDFLKEYLKLGHMSHVIANDNIFPSYYLPHHAVVRESISTKLRIVFDASARTDSGLSLNDIQFIGPSIVNDLFDIILRFRQYRYVVMADVAKMYRQVLVYPEDRCLQRILWRDEPTEPIREYELNTVTYGTSSAPYLAMRCLLQLAQDCREEFPLESEIIQRDFYVDDLITGFDSEEKATSTCQQIVNILKNVHFPLRKWHSNNKRIINNLPQDDPLSILPLSKDETVKPLGVYWNSNSDVLTYKVLPTLVVTHTKRTVLSDIAKVFDPLGMVSPCIITCKIIIQKLWSLKLGWDDPLPVDLNKQWISFLKKLHFLNNLLIPRRVLHQNTTLIELHGFCDASQDAYAACIYVRNLNENNEIKVNLLCAKTKVAPIKVLTIPRLELCSAVILSKLAKKVMGALTIPCKISYWSDSEIVLAWLRKEPKQLQTFVCNRISAIQKLTNVMDWNHVISKDNPADIASRGICPSSLLTSRLWWHGPQWLGLPIEKWPNKNEIKLPDSVPDLIKRYSSLVNVERDSFPFENYSNYNKLLRIIAYCLKFVSNLRKPKIERQIYTHLSTKDLEAALLILVKWAQNDDFSNEIYILKSNLQLKPKHNLQALSPFVDELGLLRVGGRLINSLQPHVSNHPFLLSGKHYFTKLIFQHEHNSLHHAGPQSLLYQVRQRFWPTAGLQIAKKICKECIICFKFRPKIQFPVMGNLPKERVNISYPFCNTGVDFAGPFILKDRKGRGSKPLKAWICLFVCFASKAVHIEVITSLSSEAFLAGFRRFISRRGKPAKVFSDNGTNFVGAARQLKDFINASKIDIITTCTNDGIDWSFIPPHAPHFGGLWEAGVKSVKSHLFKVIGDAKLTYEEFSTILTQIEATLNSRPLSPLSSDPHDLSPLTPAHFLIGRQITALPEKHLIDVPINTLTRFQLLQQMNQSFWKRWSKEYLHQLQQKTKWKTMGQNPEIGTLVLVKQDNLPALKWLLGRIVELHPGSDNIVRVVTIKTANGLFKRAVTGICPLPCVNEES